jgi:hypothetical protein
MQPVFLSLHPDAKVRIGTIGKESQSIIVVDNFIAQPRQLIECAANNESLHSIKGLYPGLRANSPNAYMELMRASLGELICKTFSISPQNVADAESFFSIVSVPPEQLQIPQRIPHIDGANPNDIAFLHYLCDEKYGGTSFYRHKSTGHEYVDQKRFKPYLRILEQEIPTLDLSPAQYINGDNALFERIVSLEAKFNRLIIYRGTSLHSGDIGPNYNFDTDPRSGRLTITSFLYSAV